MKNDKYPTKRLLKSEVLLCRVLIIEKIYIYIIQSKGKYNQNMYKQFERINN